MKRSTTWLQTESHSLLIGVFCLSLLFGACSKKNNDHSAAKTKDSTITALPYGMDRTIIDSIWVDLDLDGSKEFVVTSQLTDAPKDPLFPDQFDRVEVFAKEGYHFKSLFVDPVESGVRLSFDDMTQNGTVDIIVSTDAGGNDPIASRGLNVYGFRTDGALTVLFYAQAGDPEIKDLNKDGTPEILVFGEYAGIMSHADMIGYTEGIYTFDGQAFTEENLSFTSYFDYHIGKKRAEYQKLKAAKRKDGEEQSAQLYRAFAAWLLWLSSKGVNTEIRRTWEAEKSFLMDKVSPVQYEDLDELISDLLSLSPPLSLNGK